MRKFFTKEEDNFIINNYYKGRDFCSINLNRSAASISNRASKLGVNKSNKRWSDSEINYLKNNYNKYDISHFCKKFNRNEFSIRSKLSRINIKKIENWSNDQEFFLKKNIDKGILYCCNYLNKSCSCIISKCKRLNLSCSFLNKDLDNKFYRKYFINKMYWNAKNRAKTKGINFSINIEDIKISKKCPVFCHDFLVDSYYAPSIDRFDNSKGYEKNNIDIISFRANSIKGDGNLEIFEKIKKYIDRGSIGIKGKCSDLEKQIFERRKLQAKKNKIEFSISLDDIFIPNQCPIFNVDFVLNQKHNYNLSLDRIDNNKGYIKGNVAIISNKANFIKKDASFKEIDSIINWLKFRKQLDA